MCDFALNSESEVIKKNKTTKTSLTKQFKLLGNDMDAKKWNSRRREVVYKVDWSDEEKREMYSICWGSCLLSPLMSPIHQIKSRSISNLPTSLPHLCALPRCASC